LTINEPILDPKGKKRATSELEEEDTAGPSIKRSRTSTYYSLRSSTTHPPEMPRKTRYDLSCLFYNYLTPTIPRTSAKGKAALKSKMAAAGSSHIESEDVEMLDPEHTKHDESDIEPQMGEKIEEVIEDKVDHGNKGDKEDNLAGNAEDDEDDDGEDDDDDGEDNHPDSEGGRIPSSDAGPIPGGMDEATALAIFGDYRQFGSYMMSLSSRLKSMLNNIKSTADPTTRLVTLQELSELLSISTEDTLAGSFQVEQFVRELVKILGGKGVELEDEDGDEDSGENDADAALAAALAMSTGNSYQGDENLEAQVLACRCLANLMEAMPGVAHTVVYHGAIPVLCSKLMEISYIDLAEQTLSVSLSSVFVPKKRIKSDKYIDHGKNF
jgi:E3 ubiquitin-protein ligase TRIP12